MRLPIQQKVQHASPSRDLGESRRAGEHLLKRALALELLDLALQHIDAVVLERLLDALLGRGVACDGARRGGRAGEEPQLAAEEEPSDREEEVCCGVAPARGGELC